MKRVLFDVAALIARVVTGVIFLAHGWQKWQGGLSAASEGFREMGIPMPVMAAGFSTVVETVGGVFLILGLLVRPVALLLLINMIGAIVFVHGSHGVLSANNGWELPGALGALCLLFLALGGGRIGLDAIFASVFRRRGERRVAEEELAAHAPSRDDAGMTAGTAAGTAAGTTATGTAQGGRTGGPMTPAERDVSADRPEVPRQPAAPDTTRSTRPTGSGRFNDDDMREIDALVSDEPPQHHKPPNR